MAEATSTPNEVQADLPLEPAPGVTPPVETAPPAEPTAESKLKSELQKWQKAAKEAQDKLKSKEVDELKATAQWQKIAELKEQEAKEAKEEKDRFLQSFVLREKYSSIRQAAISAGIRQEALEDVDLIDFPEVQVETSGTGKVVVQGVSQAVQKLRTLRPHWFKDAKAITNPVTPSVNGAAAKLTVKDIFAAEAEAKKTGDNSKYLAALKAYQIQGSAN